MSKNLFSFFNTTFLLLSFIMDTLVKMLFSDLKLSNGLVAMGILGSYLLVNLFFSRKLFKDAQSLLIGLLISVGVALLVGVVTYIMIQMNFDRYSLVVDLLIAIVLAAVVGKYVTFSLASKQ